MWYNWDMKENRVTKGRKTAMQLERYFKGAANHRRLEVLFLVAKSEGVTLDEISEVLRCNIKTISEHTKKLVGAGLLNKSYKGRSVAHVLSPYGKKFVSFAKTF
jgi:DNA-binding MarR family transcriptional regulator